jgi:aminoglycoside phosphotransferase
MPNGGGDRLGLDEVPERVRRAIEEILGAPVVAAHSQPGGFSPGLAARLVLTDGRRAFAKAVGSERNPDAPGMHRREVENLAGLPDDLPVPRLLGSYDDGDWVALVVEDVDGVMPAEPWRPAELARVVEAMAELADRLTPSPIEGLPVAVLDEAGFRGWRTLAADPDAAAPLGPAVRARLDELAAIEATWTAAAEGDALVHGDLRADNILLTPDRVVFVDWPHARIGAPWLYLLFLLPSAAATGTDPEEAWAGLPAGADRRSGCSHDRSRRTDGILPVQVGAATAPERGAGAGVPARAGRGGAAMGGRAAELIVGG